MKNNHKMTNRLIVTMLSLLMLFSAGPFFNADIINTYAANTEVATWSDLSNAIQGATDGDTITITADLYAESTIDVPKNVTIKGKDGGVTIYQKKRGDNEKYDTMFKVKSGGDLTLGDNLTLTGETGCASGGGGGDDDPIQTTTLQVVDDDPFFYYIGIVPKGSNNIGEEEKNNAVTVVVYDDRTIKYDGKYLGRVTKDGVQVYAFDSSVTAENAVKLTNYAGGDGSAGQQVIPLVEGEQYRLIDGTAGYLGMKDGLISPVSSLIEAYEVTAIDVEDYSGSGSGGSGDDQGCDTPNCNTYTKDNFVGGDVGEPKGFFIQVNQGGTATLDGGTIEHFYTSTTKDETVKHVAPVVANGGTFNIISGKIQNNVVGYIAKDSMSDSDANAIKQYIKGAAPNAPRKGSLANADNRRRRPAGIDDGVAGSGITGTAGAVIYTNSAKGTISGGSISYNRGDTGGIMVSGDGSAVDITGADVSVDHNVGVQFGGGAFVEDGGFLGMSNGTMSENVAWFGGGAVFATENGIAWLLGEQTSYDNRKDGKFTLDGGTLNNNTSFTRGGAILADSDGVALINGNLTNNKSRMLGGAVYVMGDDPRYTYLVYIENGYVHDNKAVSATMTRGTPATELSENKEENMALSKILNSAGPCEDNKDLFTDNMTKNSDDMVDGPGNDGTGGGVWLCAYGNTNLNLDNNKFIVDKNYASGSVSNNYNGKQNYVSQDTSSNKTGGNDIHKDTKGGGNVVFSGISLGSGWMNENTGNDFAADFTPNNGLIRDYGQRNLGYTGTATPSGEYVNIAGNISRRGGGLAADGTFVFGTAQNIANIYAEMEIEKKWKGGSEPEDIVVRVYAEKDGKKYYVQDVPLTKEAQQESELDTVFSEKNYKGRFVVPMTVEDDQGNVIQVFEPKIESETYNLNDSSDLTELAEKIDAGKTPTLDTSSVKFVFEEGTYDDDGNFVKSDKYNFISDNVYVDTADAQIEKKTQQLDSNGRTREVLTVSNSAIYMKNPVINDIKSEIEKYVNEAVHKDIAVDKVFKYDILAYVSADADKVVITDQLVKDLEFALGEATILDIGEKINHKPNYDVNGNIVADNNGSVGIEEGDSIFVEGDSEAKATKVSGDGVEVTMEDGKLVVVLDNKVTVDEDAGTITREYDTVTKLRGHWVKVSFNAQIKSDLQERIKAGEAPEEVLTYAEIKAGETYKPDDSIYTDGNRPEPNVGNDPVVSDQDHKGVENTASYKIDVLNVAKYQDESNTVTVKPEESEVEKYVNQAVHKDIDLDEVFTYDIIGYITKDADKVVFEDELVSDLEFVDTDEITVKYLDSNNHKPKNDINGKEINDDASVASEGWKDVDNDGLTINADQSSGKLTVTIDDLVETAPDGEVIDRERETVLKLRGKYVKVTFKAQIKKEYQDKINAGTMKLSDLQNVKIKADDVFKPENSIYGEDENRPMPNVGNKPVESDEDHDGIINTASYTIDVANKAAYKDESNTVTVKPEMPEIEKYVNQAVHKDIDLSEVFTYDIMAYVTKDADKVLITDELNEDLQFVSKDSDIIVSDMGAENNHKPTNNVKAKKVNSDATVNEKGTELKDANVKIDGNVLTVEIPDATSVRGNWVRVRFQCKIKDGKTVADLKYTTINPTDEEDRAAPNIGNAPVESKEQHNGVPNKASYTIGVKNEAGIIEDKYSDESNTVTVKPEDEKSSGTPKLKIKKTSDAKNAKPGDEIPYTITLTNSGSADAKDVVITDTMDANLTYISDDWDGINEGQTITWTVDVPAGMSLEINLLCRIDKDASGKVVNNVKLSNVKGEYVEVEKDNCEVVLPAYEGADTGDDTEMMPWMLLFIASAAAVTTGTVYRRKRSR